MYAYERWCTSLPRYASTAGGGAGSAVWPLPAAARPAGGCGWPGLRHHALSRRSEPCSAAGSGVLAARRGWRSPPCGGACQEIARRWSALQEQQRGSVVLFVSARQMCEVCAERLPALLGAVLMGGGSRREFIGHPAGADPPRVDWVQGRSVFMEQSVLEVEIRLAKVTRALPPILRQAPPLRSRRAIWLKAFDDGHVCQAARLAHGLEAKALAPRAKRMNQGGHQACSGGAKGMAQRDGATVDVQALRIGPRVFEPCKGNAGECFSRSYGQG